MTQEEFIGKLKELNETFDEPQMRRAYEFAEDAHKGQVRLSGESYISHPASVALILAELELDDHTIMAGLLHDVIEDTKYSFDEVALAFGQEVAEIVDGVTKIDKLKFEPREVQQAENFRKMLLAMSKDVRVILVKLADRLHNMRTLKFKSEESRVRISDETLEIYVPIAHRLGIFRLKWELEDLSFKYKFPTAYRDLAEKLDKKRKEREGNISEIISQISGLLDESGIEHTIYGRPKNLYSIYKKMTFKKYTFEEIHDLTAIRVIVQEVSQCYSVLGIIHSKWKPIPGRFKDYIAMPKPNMYQSLHTTLINDKGETFEVQIRTEEMHKVAEYGIAAHWRYKDGKPAVTRPSKMDWVEQMIEWQNELDNPQEFITSVKMDLFNTRVYVFTPGGDVMELPEGSTPIDFAYKIHTDVGNRCIGAKVNSRIVPLNYRLKIGDIVEILTSKTSQGPSRDWLSIVKSSQAKNKIKAFLKREHHEENIEKGREMLEAELKKHRLLLKEVMTEKVQRELIEKLSTKTIDNLYASIGYGDINLRQVMPTIRDKFIHREQTLPIKAGQAERSDDSVIVEGMNDMLIRLAKCCNPIPGDSIIGFITRGSGITVHRSDCTNFNKTSEGHERFIEVFWNPNKVEPHASQVRVVALDRPSLLTEVTSVIQNQNVPLRGLSAKVNNNNITTIIINFDVVHLNQLTQIMSRIKSIHSVLEVQRL